MKRVFLSTIALVYLNLLNAQVLHRTNEVHSTNGNNNSVVAQNTKQTSNSTDYSYSVFAQKSTLGGGRWYSFIHYLQHTVSSLEHYSSFNLPLWNDTTAICVDSLGISHFNAWTSDGEVLDPTFTGFNNPTLYSGQIMLTDSDAYIVDSIRVFGKYMTSATGSPGDSLKIGMVWGNGNDTTNLIRYFYAGMSYYGIDTLPWLEMFHDSLHNTAAKYTGATTTPIITTFSLADTFSNYRTFAVTHMNVPPGNKTGVSVSFHNTTQVPNPLSYPTNDTLQHYNSTLGYNAFYSKIMYKVDSAYIPTVPDYFPGTWNAGMFKREGASDGGWGGYYVPIWAWNMSGVSKLQYPYIDVHVICATCGIVGIEDVNKFKISKITAFPIPANNEFNIAFSSSNSVNATVTICNLLGNVIDKRDLMNVNEAKATFNTTALPTGIYIFYIVTNTGQKYTNKFSIVH